jgi:hypothetical protein
MMLIPATRGKTAGKRLSGEVSRNFFKDRDASSGNNSAPHKDPLLAAEYIAYDAVSGALT